MATYPRLFSEWKIRNTTIKNRVVFPPTCPSWVSDPWNGLFIDMATHYYRERAEGGVGLIIIGGTHVHRSSLMAPLLMPQLFDDRQIEPLSKIADAVHKEGCKLAIQLWHSGVRGFPTFKQEATYDPDETWYSVSPSQVPLGEFPGASTPKELDEDEIEELLEAFGSAAVRAFAAGLDGVELHLSHGYLPWQFISPLYNKRTDRWGGSQENRLRFPLEALKRMRAAAGDDRFVGYRINSTSFWPGDLEIDEVRDIVAEIERRADIDYVNVSAGVHHAFIHTPMEFEAGWERGYARKIREVSSKPVLLVGRITTPDVAERLLEAGDGDAICLARQLFTDAHWAKKAQEGRTDDIRACVAANFCWKSVSRGGRVQCIYNPTVGREGKWGEGTLVKVAEPKSVLVIGGGPAGLEYARVASARGHNVTLYEAEGETGGHVRVQSLLPTRAEYGEIGRWLAAQAEKNGTRIVTGAPVTEEDLDQALEAVKPDHVVVATGSSVAVDGFQGWTSEALPGWGDRQLRRLGHGGPGSGPPARQGHGAGRPLRRGGAAHRRRLQGGRRRRGDAGHPLADGGHGDHPRRLSRLDPAEALPDRGDGLRRSLRPPHRRRQGDALQRPSRGGGACDRGGLDRHGDRPALGERAQRRRRRPRRLGRDHRRRHGTPHGLRGGLRRPPPGPQALTFSE